MPGDRPSHAAARKSETDQPTSSETVGSPFGGLLDVLGKAKRGAEHLAESAGHTAADLARKAPGAVSGAINSAPKVGDQIDKGANAVNGAVRSAPEPVRNIVGHSVTNTMRSAADLTRLPAEVQKNGMSANVAKRAVGDLAGVGAVAVPGVGGAAGGLLGNGIKRQIAESAVKAATDKTKQQELPQHTDRARR